MKKAFSLLFAFLLAVSIINVNVNNIRAEGEKIEEKDETKEVLEETPSKEEEEEEPKEEIVEEEKAPEEEIVEEEKAPEEETKEEEIIEEIVKETVEEIVEENKENLSPCSSSSVFACSISNEDELNAWANNSNVIYGKLIDSVVLTTSKSLSYIKNLDLNGYGIKADDKFSGNMFVVNGSLTIKDSSKDKGGLIDGGYVKGSIVHDNFIRAFVVSSNANLTIEYANITRMFVYNVNETNATKGGVIYNNGSVTIKDGEFFDCASGFGGAIYNEADSNDASLEIKGGVIRGCEALGEGGAIYNIGKNHSATTTISDGMITNCYAGENAAAIFNSAIFGKAKLIIKGGTIDSCNLEEGNGAAIYNYTYNNDADVVIYDGTIINCIAKNGIGGAIYNENQSEGYHCNIKIYGGLIENCRAYYGGAIYNITNFDEETDNPGHNSLTINGGEIKNCSSNSGGAIFNYTNNGDITTTINGGTISDCYSYYGGAIYNYAYYGEIVIEINDGTIKDCYADVCGGAIYNNAYGDKIEFTINGGTISDCDAYGSAVMSDNGHIDGGGAIYNFSAVPEIVFTINGGKIINCQAYNGAAILNEAYDVSNGEDANYSHNKNSNKDNNDIKRTTIKTIITKGIIKDCTAHTSSDLGGGGAILINAFTSNAETIVKGGTIDSCNAEHGGAIKSITYDARSVLTIKGGTISNCSAEYGGAIQNYAYGEDYSNNTILNIYGGTIDSCKAEYGGAIHNITSYADYAILNIYGGTIKNCSADYLGGAIYSYANDEVININIYGGTIDSCKAQHGGAIFNNAYERNIDINIGGGKIVNCSAEISGGAIYNNAESGYCVNLIITDGKILNCSASSGGAIFNATGDGGSKFIIEGGLIDSCNAENGGAIYIGANKNSAYTNINGGVIKNCSAKRGGAIFNDAYYDSYLTLNGGTIDNCSAEYGGAIYNYGDDDPAVITIEGGVIKNCSAEDGGAIYNYAANYYSCIRINGGVIKNCKSECSAISNNYGNGEIYLNGNITLDNYDELGNKDDIYLYEGSRIVLGENFVPTKQIGIWNDLGNLGEKKIVDNAVVCDGYQIKYGEELKDIFISANGQEYLIENGDTLSIMSVQIVDQPSLKNKYTVSTDIAGTPITTSYQWYKADIFDAIEIGIAEREYVGEILDFYVTQKDEYCEGNAEYMVGSYQWHLLDNRKYNNLFRIDGLKEGQVVSFDYETDPNAGYIEIALVDENDNYQNYIYANKVNGSYKATVPHDGSYWIYINPRDSWNDYNPLQAFVRNVVVDVRGKETPLFFNQDASVEHPEANAYNYVRVTYTNNEGGAIATEDSKPIKFGEVLEGNKQIVVKGSHTNVSVRIEATKDEFKYFDATGQVYLDSLDNVLLKGKDYTYEQGSIILNFSSRMISKLSTGEHTFYVNKSTASGEEFTAITLYVVNPSKPDPKDESCEVKIGPTWHWNNTKGICEEVSVVGTYTR